MKKLFTLYVLIFNYCQSQQVNVNQNRIQANWEKLKEFGVNQSTNGNDRIAFSGQVPCNLTGASVGDYIIPKEGTSDAITGEAVSTPTFEQYQKAVGKVWKVLDNGNAWISVKIG